MFDYQVVKQNYQRAKPQIKEHGFLYEIAAQEIMDALSGLNLKPSSVLVLGYFPHVRLLQKQFPLANIAQLDGFVSDLPSNQYDAIISLGQIQWMNDPISYVSQLKALLSPGGFLGCVFPGENTFITLRQALITADMRVLGGAHLRVNPTISASDALLFLQSQGFKDPLVHISTVELKHNSIYDLMVDIRNMGGCNATKERRNTFTPKSVFNAVDVLLKAKQGYISTPVDLVVMIGHA
jgi:SAM-dependent methyltransferase